MNELIQEQHNIFNKKYTIKVKEAYQHYIHEDLKKTFDNYTNNIIHDTIIYEQHLIMLSCMFEKKYKNLCEDNKFKMNWNEFIQVIVNIYNL